MENNNFEEMLQRLEEVVKKLEDKNIKLEDAVTNYKLGLELSKKLYELLENAEKVTLETIK